MTTSRRPSRRSRGLRAAALVMRAELDALRAEGRRVEDQNERLRHFIRPLQRMQFGRRSEKLDPDQLALALEDLEQAVAESEAEEEKADRRCASAWPGAAAEPRCFAGALPRIEVVMEPEQTVCPCCKEAMHVIGEDAPPSPVRVSRAGPLPRAPLEK